MADPSVIAAPGFLVDTATNERFEFQYNPIELNDSIASGWVKLKAPGSTHPRLQWTAGGERSWSFKVQFYRETTDIEEVSKKVRFLQSLMYPKYDDAGQFERGPAICLFVFGTLYSAQVIVDRCDVRYYKLFTPGELQPIIADVDLRLVEYEREGRSFDQIRPGSP
jgi:hypothetical protein